jgi:hypothetical protein
MEVNLSPWVFSCVHRTMAASTTMGRVFLETCRIRWYRSPISRGMSLSSRHPPRERSMSVPSPSVCSSDWTGLRRRVKENSAPEGVKIRGCLRSSMIRRFCEGGCVIYDADLYSGHHSERNENCQGNWRFPMHPPRQADDLSCGDRKFLSPSIRHTLLSLPRALALLCSRIV